MVDTSLGVHFSPNCLPSHYSKFILNHVLMKQTTEKRTFTSDCKITTFRVRNGKIRANVLDSDNRLLISGTLDDIINELNNSEIVMRRN